MKKILRKLLIPFLTLLFFTSNFTIPVQAATGTDKSDTSVIEAIAKNAPQYILGSDKKNWSDVTVINCKPLYDFNDKLFAYSLDLKSNIDNSKAYVIVSTSEKDEPILQFAERTYSPYDKATDSTQTCIYDGVGGYYLHESSNKKYHDLTTNTNLGDTEIKFRTDNSKNRKYISLKPNIAKKNRENLSQKASISSMITPLAVTKRILTRVPDYDWHIGCSPTSAAMVLRFSYEDLLEDISTETLIEHLATAMKTGVPPLGYGHTYPENITPGIRETISYYEDGSHGRLYCEYDSSVTFSELKTQIDDRFPFVITVYYCEATAPSYPDGFGTHSMACIGYSISGNSPFMVVRDTGCDGSVYVSYDSSVIGNRVEAAYVRPGETSQE